MFARDRLGRLVATCSARLAAVGLVLLAATAVAPLATSSGSVASRIDSTQGRLDAARGREQVLTSDISGYNNRIDSLEGEIAGLRAREARIQSQLAAKQAELEQVRAELTAERQHLARLKLKLAHAMDVLADRLVAIYETGEPDYVDVILSSDGFPQMLHNIEFMSRISERDANLVRLVKRLKAESKQRVEHLAALEARVQRVVDEIRAKRDELAQARSAVEARSAELATARDRRQAALDRVRSQRSSLEGNLKDLRAEQASIAQRINDAQQGIDGSGPVAPQPSGPIKRGSGRFVWPCDGPINGVFGEQRPGHIHAGDDIGCGMGTPIHAAAAGTVTFAGVQGGYGNVIIVDHGGGLATLYAHQSSFAVGTGAHVSQGSVIGYVGCTGNCSGPHVHFEVHVNGSAVDPMGYL